MKDKELNVFLASVRRTRFVDYLDPLGETAQNAFERRLSWARVSQHDPAYADEARFLLDHAEALREVLRRELEEDDWVEEADVGREWDSRVQPRASRLRENDRITEIFQADDAEASKAQSRGRPAAGPSKSRAPALERPTGRVAVTEEAETRRDPPRRSPPEPAPRQPDRGRGEVRRTPPPVRGSTAAPPSREPPVREPPVREPPVREPPRARDARATRSAPPAPVRSTTANPPPQRVVGASQPRVGAPRDARTPVGSSTRAATSRPPAAERGIGRNPGREFAERAEFGSRLAADGRAARNAALRAMAEDEETSHHPHQAEVELEDWDAPEEPSTGIMRLEDVTAPPMKAINPHDETVALPSAQVLLNEGATRPTLPTRLRGPTTPLGGETQIRRPGGANTTGSNQIPVVEPKKRRRRWPWVLAALMLLGMTGAGLAAAGVGAGTIALSSDQLLELVRTASSDPAALFESWQIPAPSPPSPKPAPPAPAPAPAPPPVEVAAPAPPPVEPAPAPADPSKAAAVTPPPKPAPAPAPVEPSPQSRKPPPDPEPAGPASAPPADVRGLWVGSTSAGKSFKLTVLGQTEGDFEGTVELQLEDDTFTSLAVTGKVTADAMTFKGSGSTFTATVNGRRATGKYTLKSGATKDWTAVH